MSKLLPLFTLLGAVFLSSCTTIAEHFPGVYAIDVNQGNIIDQDMINQLRPNMNKRQVLFIMGSPMLVDVFHKKRWEYIYSEQKGGEARLQSRISLFFDQDNLVSVQGDFKPSEFAVVRPSLDTTVDVPKRPDDKTVFGEIANFFSSDDTGASASDADIQDQEASAVAIENPDEKTDASLKPDTPATQAELDADSQDNKTVAPDTETPEADTEEQVTPDASEIPPL